MYSLKMENISLCQSLFTVYLHYINKKTDRPGQQPMSWSSYGQTVVYQVCVHQMQGPGNGLNSSGQDLLLPPTGDGGVVEGVEGQRLDDEQQGHHQGDQTPTDPLH